MHLLLVDSSNLPRDITTYDLRNLLLVDSPNLPWDITTYELRNMNYNNVNRFQLILLEVFFNSSKCSCC